MENQLEKKPPVTEITKIPTMQELIEEPDESKRDNALMVLLNQDPFPAWLKEHPTIRIKNADNTYSPHYYLPINRVEWLLSRIFTKWWVEIKSTQLMANSVVVAVRVYVQNPLSKLTEWNEGIGASPIQTDSGKGAMDWNYAKSHGVQIAAPIAESFAIKDAAEKWGKVFGKDLNRKDIINYDGLLKPSEVTIDHIMSLYHEKLKLLSADDKKFAERIINAQEKASYTKLYNKLKSL
jgi:hypothetical protein